MGFLIGLFTILFILTCILLVFIILIQPHHSESGLAGAFGGGGSESFLGTKAVSVATKITVVLAIIFIFLAVALAKIRKTAVPTSGKTPSHGTPIGTTQPDTTQPKPSPDTPKIPPETPKSPETPPPAPTPEPKPQPEPPGDKLPPTSPPITP